MIVETSPARERETARRAVAKAAAVDPLLTRREVEAEVGLSRSTIYRMIEAGTFPPPRRISAGTVRWPRSEIEKWKARQPLS